MRNARKGGGQTSKVTVNPTREVTNRTQTGSKQSDLVDKTNERSEAADQAVQEALDELTATNELLKKRNEEIETAHTALAHARKKVAADQECEPLRSSLGTLFLPHSEEAEATSLFFQYLQQSARNAGHGVDEASCQGTRTAGKRSFEAVLENAAKTLGRPVVRRR